MSDDILNAHGWHFARGMLAVCHWYENGKSICGVTRKPPEDGSRYVSEENPDLVNPDFHDNDDDLLMCDHCTRILKKRGLRHDLCEDCGPERHEYLKRGACGYCKGTGKCETCGGSGHQPPETKTNG